MTTTDVPTLHPFDQNTTPQPTYFVLAPAGTQLPERTQLIRELSRVLSRELSGWVQIVALELLAAGRVEIREDALVRTRVDPRASDEQQLIVVQCEDRLGPRRPGLWTALCVAEALAERVGGELVDPRRAGFGLRPRAGLRPSPDARVHVVDHLGVPCSRTPGQRSRHWLTTIGMAHFGLPDLEIEAVPGPLHEIAGRLLLGVAQHLVDGTVAAPRRGAAARELLLTLGELLWALGHDPRTLPNRRGRGWTRIALARESGRAWPELISLRPPAGARQRGSEHWITAAWLDLVGIGPAPLPSGVAPLRERGDDTEVDVADIRQTG